MRIAVLLLALISLPAGCTSALQRPDPHTISPTAADKPIAGRTTLNMPIVVPGQSAVLVPFAIESDKDIFQTRDPYAAGGFVGKPSSSVGLTSSLADGDFASAFDSRAAFRPRWTQGGGSVRWHNAILRDLTSGDEWSILDRRGVINWWSWYGVQAKRDGLVMAQAIVFTATIADSNHDGLLNDLDARVAILADANGRKPRIVTPTHAQVWNVVFDSENDRFYMLVVADTNKDSKYDYNDAPVPYAIESGGAAATPIVSDGLLGRVESLLK